MSRTTTDEGLAAQAAEIAIEQRHVDRVYARVTELRTHAESMRDKGFAVADGARNEDELEAGQMLLQRDIMVAHASKVLQSLDAEHEGLVFGRLDLVDGETIYVGRLGIRDEEYNNLVTDWRAPASAAFYQATADQPMDVIRRRVIRSSGGTVTDIDDDLLMPDHLGEGLRVVGEGALMASLSRARGERMHNIVATIQKEQDEAIRAPAKGVTQITGGPGTGKTAVALHRAAYLLYRDRRAMAGSGLLVIGPSPVFTNYISRVLPSIGEDSAELRSLGEVLDGVRAARQDEAELATLKGEERMRKVLRSAVRLAPEDAPGELRTTYKGQVLRLEGRELARLRRKVHARGGLPNASRVIAAEMLLEALWGKASTLAESSGGELSFDRAQFLDDMAERLDFHRFVVRFWVLASPADVLRGLADERKLARAAGKTLTASEVRILAASFAGVEEQGFTVSDIPLLDELRVLLGHPRKRSGRSAGLSMPQVYEEYAHVVVDEAQDLSPMQWRMVGRRGRFASWTIVGDPVQSSRARPEESVAAMRTALERQSAWRDFTLATNYRNSAEIFGLAARVIAPYTDSALLPDAVRATGIEPRIHSGAAPEDVRAAVTELLDSVAGTVGVITAMDRVTEATGWLDGFTDDRIRVVGSLDAKGLEYDAVVLYEPDELIAESAAGRRGLYVALTRATQELIVLTSGMNWLPD
ncbi:HelD family protein [Sciscionella marina]|uniref:HelD family protein n=1 Tax=Sciscionella marina TaxID=508770 RepID=UPI000376761F|nr:ATP-binding domain-containing protein [Sciscionella marina]